MLLRLSVTNHRSFRESSELSMVATRLADEPSHRHQAPGTDHGVLPVMALYGANASGKSNLVHALIRLRNEVVYSFTNRKPDGPIRRSPFLLDQISAVTPTLFAVDFVVGGVRYDFGVSFDDERVLEEWLYAWPEGRRQVWYHRKADEAEPYSFGGRFKGQKKLIAELTRPNSLFLSAGAQHNHEQLTPVYHWFSEINQTQALTPKGLRVFSRNSSLLKPQHQAFVRTLLADADLGVVDFRSGEDQPLTKIFQDLLTRGALEEDDREALETTLRENPPVAIELAHQGADGTSQFLAPELESHGTAQLLNHCEGVLDALVNGSLLVVDELDAGLHPHLSAAIVGLFTSPESNPRGAQLLFTTHDQSLMTHLRRDQVVFVEKQPDGTSALVPLSDYQTRKRDDIRQGYADGRFGGVPMVGDLAALVAAAGLVAHDADAEE